MFSMKSFFIPRSPEQYITDFINEEGVREIIEYEGGIVVFDDKWDYNQENKWSSSWQDGNTKM